MAPQRVSSGNKGGPPISFHRRISLCLCLAFCYSLSQLPRISAGVVVARNATAPPPRPAEHEALYFSASKGHETPSPPQDPSYSREVPAITSPPSAKDTQTIRVLNLSLPHLKNSNQKCPHSTASKPPGSYQPPTPRKWFNQLKRDPLPLLHQTLPNAKHLPSQKQLRVFMEFLQPVIKENISHRQIQTIVNQWQLFRQSARKHRHLKQLRDLEGQAMLRRQQTDLAVIGEKAAFRTVVLRREARALQKATSFEEFQSILLRTPNPPIHHSVMSSGAVAEVGGGVVFHDKSSPSDLPEARPRSISKRSLDSQDYDDNDNDYAYDSEEAESEDHSQQELHGAYLSYREFLSNSCTPRNKTICMKALLGSGRVDHSTLVLPPGAHLQRCDNPTWSSSHGSLSSVNVYQSMLNQATRMRSKKALESLCSAADSVEAVDGFGERPLLANLMHHDFGGSCNCALPEEECLPTDVNLKLISVVVYNTVTHSTKTELIALTEHLGCQCRRRCENRKCVPPLILNNYTYDDCFCTCPDGDSRCQALLDGKARFNDDELLIPLDGSFILPPCFHGPMDDVHLYHRHCPRADGNVGFENVKTEL